MADGEDFQTGGKTSKRKEYNFFAEVVEEVTPAVVNIQTLMSQHVPGLGGYRMMFGQAQGTGFVVDKDGLVITNAHVVGYKEDSRVKVRRFTYTQATGATGGSPSLGNINSLLV